MKKFYLSASLIGLLAINSIAQCPEIGALNASYAECETSIALTATPTGGVFNGPGVSGSNFSPMLAGVGTHTISYTEPSITTYNAEIGFANAPYVGGFTNVPLGDDQLSGALPIGFSFDFYGNTYTDFRISSNGFITFDLATTNNGCCSGQNIPNAFEPNNLVALAWNDLNTGYGGTMGYTTIGTSPNRQLIVDFNGVGHHGGGGTPITVQVKFFEGTNIIEIHSTNNISDGSAHTMGVENIDGTCAVSPAGRNANLGFSVSNEMTRFTPSNTVTITTTVNADATAPVVTCPANITLSADAGACDATATYTATATDNCNFTSQNLLTNPGAEDGTLAGWDISANGGNGWTVSGGNHTGTYSFIGSSNWCVKSQTVDLLAQGFTAATLDAEPEIIVGEWFKASGCCSANDEYFYQAELLDAALNVITTFNLGSQASPVLSDGTWQQVANSFTGYGAGVRHVRITHGSKDQEFWAGHYGTEIDDSQVRINIGENVSFDIASGSVFPLGTTTVTASSVDVSGNVGTCTFDVIVEDNENPTITAPTPVTVSSDAGTCEATTVALGTPVTDDNCSVASVNNDAPATFPLGSTTVTWTVTDGSGNTATATQTVTVEDNENPTITAPATVTVSSDAGVCEATGVALGTPVTDDNCSVASVNNDAPTAFPVGSTTVTWTVTDGSGNPATATQTVTVEDNEAPTFSGVPTNQSISANNAGCTGIATWVSPTATDNCGGTVTTTSSHNSGDAFPVGTTTVTYTSEDTEGNVSTVTFDIEVVNDLAADVLDVTDVSCNGGTDGAIDISFTGGTAPLTYSWTSAGGFTSADQNISGLVADDYEAVITDANGCTSSTGTLTVAEPTAIAITLNTSTDPTACGAADGTADVSVSGGTIATDYTFGWSDGGTYSSAVQNPNDMSAGSYTLTVTDDNGCTETETVSLTDPNGPTISFDAANSLIDLACNGDNDGAISIDVVLNGGATTATYLWDDSASSTTEDISGLTAGTYSIEVTDDNNCVASESFDVTEPDAIDLSAVATELSCNGDEDGSIDLTATGGTGVLTFLWDDASASTTEDVSGLGAGTYAVDVTDENGCTASTSASITEPDALVGSATSTDIINGNDGTTTVTVTGGTSPYSFDWTGPAGFTSTDQDLSGLNDAGVYTVTITDDNGCVTLVDVTVDSQVGLDDEKLMNITLYPNPNNGQFTIDFGGVKEEVDVKIIDAQGRVIYNDKFDNASKTDVQLNVETGVYTLQLQLENSTIVRKVVIR